MDRYSRMKAPRSCTGTVSDIRGVRVRVSTVRSDKMTSLARFAWRDQFHAGALTKLRVVGLVRM